MAKIYEAQGTYQNALIYYKKAYNELTDGVEEAEILNRQLAKL